MIGAHIALLGRHRRAWSGVPTWLVIAVFSVQCAALLGILFMLLFGMLIPQLFANNRNDVPFFYELVLSRAQCQWMPFCSTVEWDSLRRIDSLKFRTSRPSSPKESPRP